MTQRASHKRPNCEELLKRKNSWAVSKEEIELNFELKYLIDSKESESIYSVLKCV